MLFSLLVVLGNVYVADTYNYCIRKITVSTGVISTIAGSNSMGSYSGDGGPATAATMSNPDGVAVDSTGTLYVYDVMIRSNHLTLLSPLGNVYIADYGNHRIYKVAVSTGIITSIAGTGAASYSGDGGAASSAALLDPRGVTIDASGKETIHLFSGHHLTYHTVR